MAAKRNTGCPDSGCLDELSDDCVSLAVENVAELCNAIEQELGQAPTLRGICEVLAYAIACLRDDAISDANPSAVTTLVAKKASRTKVDTRPGSLFAVPAPEGTFFFVVLITRNRFGWAFGVLRHVATSSHYRPTPDSQVLRYPIYSGGRFVANGRWRRVGYVPELLLSFPREPEIYHSKNDSHADECIGPYGSAENAHNELRAVSKKEAEDVGLLSGEYRQGMLEEQFEKFLARRLSESAEEKTQEKGTEKKKCTKK